LKESAKETCEADSFLVEIVDTAEALIGGDPRSSSDFAQSTTEGTDHKGICKYRRHDARFFLLHRG
jgi:hypothetical protein